MSRILIVEDESIIAADIRRVLMSLGYEVPRPVGSSDEALSAIAAVQPALVLMDVRIRGARDGIDTAMLIRREWRIPVVFLTSHSDEATLARAKATGPYGYVLKPFEERDIRTAIEVALAKHELERRIARTERMASIGTLTTGMAHEINNPLAVVTATTDLLSRAIPRLADAVRDNDAATVDLELASIAALVSDARDSTARVARIVRSLRQFASKRDDGREIVELGVVVTRALELTAQQIQDRSQVRSELGTTPVVVADESGLVQVLTNLLVNAAQAMVRPDPRSNLIRVTTHTDQAGRAVLEVHDNGPGIPAAHLGRLFDPFFTTKSIGDGMGLGLSVAHGIVEGAGGSLTVESELGIGSLFRMTLPAAPANSSHQPSQMPGSGLP